jgi:hypothetical protein
MEAAWPALLQGCPREIPDSSLTSTLVTTWRAALRSVRVEHEPGTSIIRNDGHGGSGVTFSWGCANEVVSLAHRLSHEGDSCRLKARNSGGCLAKITLRDGGSPLGVSFQTWNGVSFRRR